MISNTTTITSVNNESLPYGTFGEYVKLNPYDPCIWLMVTLNRR